MIDTQPSRLLPALFENLDPDKALILLNIGPALPETVAFFSNFRCKLHIADLYSDLPVTVDAGEEDGRDALSRRLTDALQLPAGVQFDVVFFWDVLNFLQAGEIAALGNILQPHLHAASRAHCFAAHNAGTRQATVYYGIADQEHFSVRDRTRTLPGYRPHLQGELVSLLQHFVVDRSVLMRDQRVELLLKARL